MTQSEWRECGDPAKMLAYLRSTGGTNDAGLRRFVGTCCQRIWQLLLEDRGNVLSPGRWHEDERPASLRQLWDNRPHVERTLAEYVQAQEGYADGVASQRDLADRAIALADIAWGDSEWLDNCASDLAGGVPPAEALRACAVMFSSAASSDCTPGDVITYAGAVALFASADAYDAAIKDALEGRARYAGQVEADAQAARRTLDLGAVGEVSLGAPVTHARQAALDAAKAESIAYTQAARAAANDERRFLADLLRAIFGPLP
jgi:hypothetical protein